MRGLLASAASTAAAAAADFACTYTHTHTYTVPLHSTPYRGEYLAGAEGVAK